MKKLILIILASSFVISCSTNSANDNSNNSNNTGLLLKTVSDGSGTSTFYYNGNKLINTIDLDGTTSTLTYNGDLVNNAETNGSNYHKLSIMNYSNNLLISENSNINSNINSSASNSNSNYTYNSDGSITELYSDAFTNTSGNTSYYNNKTIRFYFNGNCIKQEYYSSINNVMTLSSSTIYTYDNKNNPLKNITGFYSWQNPHGGSFNNKISETEKNESGVTLRISQFAYQYNSQDYPISYTETRTPYTLSTSGTSSVPGNPTTYVTALTYY